MMKKSEAKMSIFGRGFAPRQPSASPQSSNGIIVYMYGCSNTEQTLVVQEFGKTFDAEQLCYMAVEKLEMTPLVATLFALAYPSLEFWCPPNEKILCSEDCTREFALRVRFIPPDSVIAKLPHIDGKMFNYLFQQIRNDFINDRIVYRDDSVKQEHLLGLGVIDMVRYGKQQNVNLTGLRNLDPHNFIPSSAKKNFKLLWDKKRLQLNFKPHLDRQYKQYENDTITNIQLTYIKSVAEYAEHYGMETFRITTNVGSGSNPTVAQVKPYDKTFPGLNIYEGKDHFHSTIPDLMSISISKGSPCQVHIDRQTGRPKVITFEDRQMALSFVSLLDGYYRLQENFHHHLCKDVQSPMVSHLRLLRCHGPVSKEWAVTRLRETASRNAHCNFLLRQSEKEFHCYTLVYMKPPSREVVCLQIRRLPDTGQYQLVVTEENPPALSSVKELIAHYQHNSPTDAISLQSCAAPANPIDPKLYLCWSESKLMGDGVMASTQQKAPEVCLVSSVHRGEPLGDIRKRRTTVGGRKSRAICVVVQGSFTSVFISAWQRDSAMVDAVVKCLNRNFDIPQQYFTDGVHQLAFWHHPLIVKMFGVCLSSPLSVIMEQAPLGCLSGYLQHQAGPPVKPSQLICAAEYLADALHYLHMREEVHGNIRCRNVLVFHHDRHSFLVKLADVGLVHYYNSRPLESHVNIERLPWIAPECYGKLSSMTRESDIYAFGITLWEMYSTGKRPYEGFDRRELMALVQQGSFLPQPGCYEEIYAIMKSCCDVEPYNRPVPQVIIRNIRGFVRQVSFTESDSDYNDVQLMDPPQGSASNGISSTGSEPLAMNSSAAINDNFLNTQRQRHQDGRSGPLMVDVRSPTSNGVVSSGGPSSTGWDSRTPLIHNSSPSLDNADRPTLQAPTSPALSVATDTTELDNYALDSPEAANSLNGRIMTVQQRPLPALPTSANRYINHYSLHYDKQQKPLGQGHYGEVLKGKYRDDDGQVQEVAIKRLKQMMYEKFSAEFEKECSIMMQLQHPNIVRIIGQSREQKTVLLVMEFVSNGCLRDYLKKNNKTGPDELLRFSFEVIEGMVYLASKKIVHRDLATRNVLVTVDIHMKISDFGLSRALAGERDYYRCNDQNSELPAPWCAPEALLHRKFNEKSDLWSYGVTFWEIFSYGETPKLGEIDQLLKLLHAGQRLPKPAACPDSIFKIIYYGCWQFDAETRKTFVEIRDELKAECDKHSV